MTFSQRGSPSPAESAKQSDAGWTQADARTRSRAIRDGLAALEKALGEARMADALTLARRLIAAAPDNPAILTAAGEVAYTINNLEWAQELLAKARAAGHAPARRRHEEVVGEIARLWQWHFRMVNDETRNEAYARALASVMPGAGAVLEIGTGAGLLALMAARAGAGHVYTCELSNFMCEAARRTIARNGLSDRISVINKFSTDLVVGEDLPEKADVIIAEIFDSTLLGEHALPFFACAHEKLLKPGGRVVPGGATLFGAFVESEPLHRLSRAGAVQGFDLEEFNCVAPRFIQCELRHYPHRLLGEPFEIFRFDFSKPPKLAGERVFRATPAREGVCHAIVVWFTLDLASGVTLSTGPFDPPTHWMQASHALARPLALAPARDVYLKASYDRDALSIAIE